MTHLAMDCSVRELCDAVVRGVGYGPAFGVCDAGGTAWSECFCVVSPFRDQSQDGLQVAEPCCRSGPMDLSDLSRRPRSSPRRTPKGMEASAVSGGLRSDHPCWGGRKIARRLADLGETDVPAPSTVTAILRRHGVALGQAGTPAHLPALRAPAAERAVADGLQRPFCLGPGPLPSVDRAGRCARASTCAWRPAATSRARRCKGIAGQHSVAMACRSGSSSTTALGRWTAVPPRWPRQQVTGPSAAGRRRRCASARHSVTAVPLQQLLDAALGRALPPHAEGRTAGRSALRRSRALPAGLRPLAHRLQLGAATTRPSTWTCRPPGSDPVPRPPPADTLLRPRVRARTFRLTPVQQRPHQLQDQDLQTASRHSPDSNIGLVQPFRTEYGQVSFASRQMAQLDLPMAQSKLLPMSPNYLLPMSLRTPGPYTHRGGGRSEGGCS